MSRTGVPQLRLPGDYRVDARDGAQVFVNSLKLTIRHVLEGRPAHDLQQTSVERIRDAASRLGGACGAGRVDRRVKILARSHNLDKFRERVSTFGLACAIR